MIGRRRMSNELVEAAGGRVAAHGGSMKHSHEEVRYLLGMTGVTLVTLIVLLTP